MKGVDQFPHPFHGLPAGFPKRCRRRCLVLPADPDLQEAEARFSKFISDRFLRTWSRLFYSLGNSSGMGYLKISKGI